MIKDIINVHEWPALDAKEKELKCWVEAHIHFVYLKFGSFGLVKLHPGGWEIPLIGIVGNKVSIQRFSDCEDKIYLEYRGEGDHITREIHSPDVLWELLRQLDYYSFLMSDALQPRLYNSQVDAYNKLYDMRLKREQKKRSGDKS